MHSIPDDVRHQALHLSSLPVSPGWKLVDGAYVVAALHPFEFPQPIEPRADLSAGDVDAAIEEARALVLEHGAETLVWITGPDHPWLGAALARRGLRNEDSPGFEAVENAMALVQPPADGDREAIEVEVVESFDAFADSCRVQDAAFEMPPEARAKAEAALHARYVEYRAATTSRRWNARLEGQVVGTGLAVFGAAGLNLFGGAVLSDARGHGVYRALVRARWDLAVSRGTPALTVQAGRMSRPVLERLGFEFIDVMPTYVDDGVIARGSAPQGSA